MINVWNEFIVEARARCIAQVAGEWQDLMQ
jgi:hypothetical protein